MGIDGKRSQQSAEVVMHPGVEWKVREGRGHVATRLRGGKRFAAWGVGAKFKSYRWSICVVCGTCGYPRAAQVVNNGSYQGSMLPSTEVYLFLLYYSQCALLLDFHFPRLMSERTSVVFSE